jgi:hypothetical protein
MNGIFKVVKNNIERLKKSMPGYIDRGVNKNNYQRKMK